MMVLIVVGAIDRYGCAARAAGVAVVEKCTCTVGVAGSFVAAAKEFLFVR